MKRKMGAPCRRFRESCPFQSAAAICFNHNIEYGDRAHLDTTVVQILLFAIKSRKFPRVNRVHKFN